MKYIQKLSSVEALQFVGPKAKDKDEPDNVAFERFTGQSASIEAVGDTHQLSLTAGDGSRQFASVGDYVVKFEGGGIGVMSAASFEQTYEASKASGK